MPLSILERANIDPMSSYHYVATDPPMQKGMEVFISTNFINSLILQKIQYYLITIPLHMI